MIFREFHEMNGTKQTLSYSFRFVLSLTRHKQWQKKTFASDVLASCHVVYAKWTQ